MRIILLHEQLLVTISVITAVVACSALYDWWRDGHLSSLTLVIRGIWALLMASELFIGTIMILWFAQPLPNPLHLVYGIVALLVTASIIWVIPRLFVASLQARNLAIAMVIVAVVLHRLAITGQ